MRMTPKAIQICRPVAVCLTLGASSPLLLAQSVPDAGSLTQQTERDRQPAAPARVAPAAPQPQAQPSVSGELPAQVTVKAFQFTGNTLLPAELLQERVRPWVGQTLDLEGLKAVTAAVSDAYREGGWVVRVLLPAQDITGGTVTLQVVEAQVGQLRLQGESRASAQQVEQTVRRAGVVPGQPLNAGALDRGLRIASDLAGVAVSGVLGAGEKPGQTDVTLRMTPEPLLYGSVGVDNQGTRSTGPLRLQAQVGLASPLGRGETFSLRLLHAEGLNYFSGAAQFPLGTDGLRLGANLSWLGYRLITPEFASLAASGSSRSAGLNLVYPLLRSARSNVYLQGGFERRNYDNTANGNSTGYGVNAASVGLSGDRVVDAGSGGITSWSATLVSADVQREATSGVAGRSTKLRYDISHQQNLGGSFSLYGSLRGQWADSAQDSSERFYAGGPQGVRAYPSGEGGGKDGQLLQLEARAALPWNLTASVFYDRALLNRDPSDSPTGGSATYQGAGVGLTWYGPKGISATATWARRVGSNPLPALDGRDQDGTLRKSRVWLSLNAAF
ncbi:ShlB/FhaC/HecB family hemolysin secretion/activation protein [Amphibiibacter pelophylacis]|uniref:ShlB/FhaC/HecB family hemolysin secretion/activation protein n=1 Tax=Amphibiibacter pelophylacis TaxID=1799477 RepID=A0ACC6NZ19_9BURK